MRRVLLHKHGLLKFNSAGRFLCFLLLISCIPVVLEDDGLEALQETPIFLCKQSDSDEQTSPSVILESFIAKGPSKAEANQTLDKTFWALKIDREVWHGDLVDVEHAESTLNASFLTPSGQIEKQWSKLNQKPKSSAAESMSEDGNGMLVMHCNPRYLRNNSSEHDLSTQAKCSKASQAQSSMAKNALPGKLMILPSPHVFNPMIFRFHDRCAWTDQAGSTNQGYWDSDVLSFFDGNTAVHTLELDLNSSLSSSIEQKTFKERINRLLDEKSTKHACNQGTSKEFAVKNMRNSPLRVYSLIIKEENNKMHGFRVDFLGNFHLGPGQSARLLISYRPDFTTGITEGDLQLVTSAGLLSLGLKANVPEHVHSFCQNAALFARAKKFFLQVCTLALILVLLVFGKMLKQEGSDANQWSSTSNAAKLSHRSHGKSQSLQFQNGKSSSIYVSIDFGCTHNESRQCSNSSSLTKAFDTVISCIIGLKLYISQVSSAQQSAGKSDTHAKQNNNPTSATINVVGKKRSSAQPRACNKPASMIHSGAGSSPLRSKVSILRKEKPIPQLDVTRVLDRAEPEWPTSVLSDKEKEKMKQRGRKKRVASLVPGSENGSDSGSSSPRSIPSSPVTRDTSCRPVTPLGSGLHVSIQNRKARLDLDDTMNTLSNKDGSKIAHWHCSTDGQLPASEKASLRIASKVQVEDQTSLQAKRTPDSVKNLDRMDKSLGILSAKPSEMSPVKEAAVRNSGKRDIITKTRGATLTVSATFPTPGQRLLHNNTCRVQEDRQKWPMVASSCSPDLVSTSVVAPHARAPGSPLSPKSPSSRSPFSSSFFTTFSGSPLSSTQMRTRRSQEGSVKDGVFRPQLTYARFHYTGTRRGTGFFPYHMRDPHYSHKRKEPHHGSESVVPYDIWGDHFADLGRRCGPYWVAKDAPFTKKPSPLPPLLQTPAFSVFSSNHPYSK